MPPEPPEPDASPARNRVTPLGDIVAVPGRGAWMGNRGRLHEGSGARDVVRRHQGKAWITCLLSFQGRRVPQWDPHHYTELFLLDEAVAFAAGHRPCAECRRPAYDAYRTAWSAGRAGGLPYARDLDDQLHRERSLGRRDDPGPHRLPWASVPDGVFVAVPEGPAVVVGDHLALYDGARYGYGERFPRPSGGEAAVLTPPSSAAVIAAGYAVQIDAAAC